MLVGRNRATLDEVEKEIRAEGGHAVSVVSDLSDVTSARRAAGEIAALNLPIAGLLNNAQTCCRIRLPWRPLHLSGGQRSR